MPQKPVKSDLFVSRLIGNLAAAVSPSKGSGIVTLLQSAVNWKRQGAPATPADTATLTAAQLLSGLLISTPTAAAAYTLPLATDLDAAITSPAAVAGDAFEFSVINKSAGANTITMTTNTGWTITNQGVMTVAQNVSARFLARKTADGAWSLYRIA